MASNIGQNKTETDSIILLGERKVVMDCQPFKVVNAPFFRDLIFSLNPGFKVPSRQTLCKKIDDKYEQFKDKIIKVFQENNSKVSFTSDM
ncbi:unnamed protein product [Rhizophagus irregularis]|nr:unnamed protein product [Rhizophagus irregularis]